MKADDRFRGPVSKPAAPVSKPPSHPPPARLVIPGVRELQTLREQLARGGSPAPEKRSPADEGRLVLFTAIVHLLRLLKDYKARVENGEACRLVVKEATAETGRLVLEIVIREAP